MENLGVMRDWRDFKFHKQEEKGTTEDEMVGWRHRLNGHEFESTPGVGDGRLACCSPWGRKEWAMTERLNGTELKTTYSDHLKFENIDFMQVIEPLEEHRYDWELVFTWRNLQLSAEVGLVNSFLGDLWLNVAKTRYFDSKIIFLFLIEIRREKRGWETIMNENRI